MATSPSAAPLIADVTPAASSARAASSAQIDKHAGPAEVISDVGASRSAAAGGVGSEVGLVEIAALEGNGRAAGPAERAAEGEQTSTASVCAELTAPACACGCGRQTKRATQTNRKTGAVKGEYQRFLRGHGAYQRKLKFVDLTPEWLEAFVDKSGPGGHWLADTIQVTVEGRRVYLGQIALLLRDGPVTTKALDDLPAQGRCRHPRCINPSHRVVLHREQSEDKNLVRPAAALAAASARLAALRART
jgi:hypothetical protein